MKHLSLKLLAETVISRRKALGLSQNALAEKTGISRTMFTRLEQQNFSPSVDQLLALSQVLDFDCKDLFEDDEAETASVERKKIAVAGTGYVGLSLAVLLSQHNDVTAVDIDPKRSRSSTTGSLLYRMTTSRNILQSMKNESFLSRLQLTASPHTRTLTSSSLQLLRTTILRPISLTALLLNQCLSSLKK